MANDKNFKVKNGIDSGGVITATVGNSTEWNTAYTYSQVGHLPLTGGTLTGDLVFSGSRAIQSTFFDLDFYTNGTVPLDVGRLELKSGGKTGWAPGDEHGAIEWYVADGSGVGARTAARIVSVNNQGNGVSTTTFEGDLAFYTSAYNAFVNSSPALLLGGDNTATFVNNVNINTGALQLGGTTVIDSSRNLTNITSIDLPNANNWSYIKNNTPSGGLRFGTKNAAGTYSDQIEISATGDYVKLNRNTTVTGTVTATGGNSTNWNTAYSWGNHATAGYYLASNPNGYTDDQTAAEILTAIKTVDGSGSGLDADSLDGYDRQELMPYQSSSDFVDGTLVTTNISASPTNGDSFVIEVTGKAYGGSVPHSIIAEGYLYADTVININGTNISGSNFTYLKVMNNGGNLCFWWPRHSYWNSYDVYVRSSSAGTGNSNRVTSIVNSVDPAGATKKIQINLATSWTSSNDGAGSGLDADLLDNQHGSYYAPNSSLGNYLPLAGGTLTGELTTDDIVVPAGNRLKFGASATPNFEIYASGTATVLHEQGAGNIEFIGDNMIFRNPNSGTDIDYYAKFTYNGAAELYFNGTKTFETTATGIDVTGTATMDGLTSSGIIEASDGTNGEMQFGLGTALTTGAGTYDSSVRWNGSAGNLLFSQGAVEKMRITATGIDVTGTVTATGGNSTNWNTAYGWGNHASAGYLSTANYGSTLNSVYARATRGVVTGVNKDTYVTAFTVNGDALASAIRVSFAGTGPSLVINCVADILVNHYQDILISTQQGFYTKLSIKVTSNDNEDFAVEVKHNGGAYTLSLNVDVFPLNNETIDFVSSHSYTGATKEHLAEYGMTYSGSGGGLGSITTDGIVSAATMTSAGLISANGGIDVNGTVTANGIELDSNDQYILAGAGAGLKIGHDASSSIIRSQVGPMYIDGNGITFRGYSPYTKHMDIATNGDVSFYEDTGTTAKFFWDASAEDLQIGGNLLNLSGVSSGTTGARLSANGGGMLRLASGGVDALYVVDGGNVGIGTTTPDKKLEIFGSGSESGILVKNDTNTNYRGIYLGATEGDNTAYGKLHMTPQSGELNITAGYSGWGGLITFDTNGSERLRIDSSGNVGIGASSANSSRLRLDNGGTSGAPQLMLTATGASTQTEIRHDTSNNLIFDNWNSGRNERMRIDTNGRVGIGTSSPATQLAVALPSGTNGDIINMARSGGAYDFNLGVDENSTWYLSNASDAKILNATYTGNVGIGRSNNLRDTLTVNKSATETTFGATTAAIDITNQYAAAFGRYSGINFRVGGGTYNESLAAIHAQYTAYSGNTMGQLVFGTRGASSVDVTERMRIDSSGNVGIGTTAPSDGKLQVYGNSSSDWAGYFYNQNANGIGLHVETNSYGTEQLLRLSSLTGSGGSNTVRMVVRADGNVGIGTSSPAQQLHVIGKTVSSVDLTVGNNSSGAVRYSGQNGYYSFITRSNYNDWSLSLLGTDGDASTDTIGTQLVTVNYTGNVGIGTTSPDAPLSIYDADLTTVGSGLGGIRVHRPGSFGQFGYMEYGYGSGTTYIGSSYTGGTAASYGVIQFRQHSNGGTPLNSMIIDASGNVGINDTTPTATLDILNNNVAQVTLNVQSPGSGDAHVAQISRGSGSHKGSGLKIAGANWTNGTNTNAAFLELAAGSYSGSNTKYIHAYDNSGTDFMVGGDGNVGIGTDAPVTSLSFGEASTGITFLSTATNFNSGKVAGIRGEVSGTGHGNLAFDTFQGGSGGGERMMIRYDGNVGIGTSVPTQKLQVEGNILLPGGSLILYQNSSYISNASNGGMRHGFVTSGYNFEGMNVGIGTSTPQSKLHVYGTQSYGSFRISPTSANGESAMAFYSDTAGVQTSNAWVVGHAGWGHTGDFVIGNQAGGGPLILVQQNGDTGIGTTAPSERLHVSGNIRVNNNQEFRTTDTGGSTRTIMRVNNSNELEYGWSGNGPVKFMGGGSYTERMRIHTNGNVGIGTSTPQSKLDVSLTNNQTASIGGTISAGTYAGLSFGYSEAGNSLYRHSAIVFERDDAAFGDARGNIHILNSPSGSASADLGDARLTILPSGNVGIGTTAPSEKLHVSGNILATGNITAYSDRTLKENIKPILNAVEKVQQLNGVTYNRNDLEDTTKRYAGIIAQDLQAVLPEAVEGDSILRVDYNATIGLLIEAIKELKTEVDDLKAKLKEETK